MTKIEYNLGRLLIVIVIAFAIIILSSCGSYKDVGKTPAYQGYKKKM